MAAPSTAPSRAPALYFAGNLPEGAGGTPFVFRLPCPPAWHDRAPAAWAAERRARRAYFVTLDALRTGRVDETEAAKAQRLAGDIRSATARGAIAHFLRVIDAVRRSEGQPVLPTPPMPLAELVVTVPAVGGPTEPTELESRYRWALEWLAARGYVVGRGLSLRWQLRQVTLDGVVVVPADARATGTPRPSGATRAPKRAG